MSPAEGSSLGRATAGAEAAPAPPAPAGADIVGRHRRLVRRTALISALTAGSRVLGYGREVLSALLFGDSSPVYDAFVTAWRVPNLFRRLLGEGAVSTALQAALTEADGDLGDAAGRRLFWSTIRLALLLLVGLCALVMGGVALMGDAMPLTGWRWLGPDPAPVRELLLRVMPYVIFICLAGLFGGGLAVRGRFTGASIGPGAMNLVAIATLVWIGTRYGWRGPAPDDGPAGYLRHLDMARVFSWGLLLSGAVQLAVLVPELARAGLLGPLQRAASAARGAGAGAAQVLWSSAPLALGAAVYQINVMVDGLMAQSLLSEGGPTTYYYANRIQQLPMALVATAATSAVFPALKALGHRGELGELRRLHDRAHLAIGFVVLPATAGLIALAEPIVAVLLHHGEFSAAGVARTATALRALSLAMLPAGAAGLLGRTYYALGDFSTPVRVSALLLVFNIVLNAVFILGLELDVGGLAWSTVLVSWLNVLLLVPGLRRRVPGGGQGVVLGFGRLLAASAACGLAAWGVRAALGGTPRDPLPLFAAIACGMAAYACAAHLLDAPGWSALRARIGRALGR